MQNGKRISVIIPALNEALSIAKVIAALPDMVDQVVVVDNGSWDGTAQVAKHAGAEVVTEPQRGYGAACLAGIKQIQHGDLVAFIDGDYSDFPADLALVISPVAKGFTSFAVGCRTQLNQGQQSMPFHQRWGTWLVCAVIRALYGFRYADIGPMRCISMDFLNQLAMSDQDFGWTVEMQIKASQLGQPGIEIPVRYRRRIGHSKISGTFRGSVLAGYKMLYWVIKLVRVSRRVHDGKQWMPR